MHIQPNKTLPVSTLLFMTMVLGGCQTEAVSDAAKAKMSEQAANLPKMQIPEVPAALKQPSLLDKITSPIDYVRGKLDPKAATAPSRTKLMLNIQAKADANGDNAGTGMSTILTIYPLQDKTALALVDQEPQDPTVVKSEHVVLPNKLSPMTVALQPETQVIGLVFQLHERANRWKLAIPLDMIDDKAPLTVELGRCDVHVKTGLKVPAAPDAAYKKLMAPLASCSLRK